MPRNKILPALPPLPKRSEIAERVLTDAKLTEILRDLALKGQGSEPQAFYPLREVACRLRVAISALTRAYRQLRKEGLLLSIRGSKTVLAGRGTGRQLNVLAFVGLPLSVSCFVTLQDYRTFVLQLRDELQSRGFVSNVVFFGGGLGALEKLEANLARFGFDTVIWFLPHISMRETILRLADKGVRVLGVSDGGLIGMHCHYEIRREGALSAIASAWKKQTGLANARVVRMRRRSAADEGRIEHALTRAGTGYEFVARDGRTMPEFMESLCVDASSGIILPGTAASILALREPRASVGLLEKCRVAFFDGPPTLLYAEVPKVPVDLVFVDWAKAATRIVDDLVSGTVLNEARPEIFEAEARMQAPLSDYAHGI